jgi:hypothetical protein
MAAAPMRQVCQTCTDADEYVTWEIEGPGLFRYTCSGPSHGADPYWWLSTGRSPLDGAGHEGLSTELGIYDDLLRCFDPAEPYIEYGIVEYRYATANPVPYQRLVWTYDHVQAARDAGRSIDYSASAFIGGALGRLFHRDALVTRVEGKATGFWSYNDRLHGWALRPGPDNNHVYSWQAFAIDNGLDPEVWPRHLLG